MTAKSMIPLQKLVRLCAVDSDLLVRGFLPSAALLADTALHESNSRSCEFSDPSGEPEPEPVRLSREDGESGFTRA
jgi:hypothetical protein